jgi:hypothetical protein
MPRKLALPPVVEVTYVRSTDDELLYVEALRLIAGWIREDRARQDQSVVQSDIWHPDRQHADEQPSAR